MKKFFQSKGFIVSSLAVLCVAILGVCWFVPAGIARKTSSRKNPSQQHDQRLVGWRRTDRRRESGAGAYAPGQSSSPEEEYPKVTSETEDEVVIDFTDTEKPEKRLRPRQKGKPSGKTPAKIIRSIPDPEVPKVTTPLRKRSRPITSRPRSQQWQRRCV